MQEEANKVLSKVCFAIAKLTISKSRRATTARGGSSRAKRRVYFAITQLTIVSTFKGISSSQAKGKQSFFRILCKSGEGFAPSNEVENAQGGKGGKAPPPPKQKVLGRWQRCSSNTLSFGLCYLRPLSYPPFEKGVVSSFEGAKSKCLETKGGLKATPSPFGRVFFTRNTKGHDPRPSKQASKASNVFKEALCFFLLLEEQKCFCPESETSPRREFLPDSTGNRQAKLLQRSESGKAPKELPPMKSPTKLPSGQCNEIRSVDKMPPT
eukprot:TRINITY_DN12526_c0_g1_i1.p1 TRINITY_DN12526_c0_g1~~TRINITY_DN12526_c0_g1_i1.p1  ORF type:complete len:267 (+),score=42.38 TRINITY_DN12526_c0_g1_i1:493-1293(+)